VSGGYRPLSVPREHQCSKELPNPRYTRLKLRTVVECIGITAEVYDGRGPWPGDARVVTCGRRYRLVENLLGTRRWKEVQDDTGW